MTQKNRLAKLEKAETKKNDLHLVFWTDAYGDGLATFDGVEMPQAEAEAKAAALPDNVQLIHIVYASQEEL